MHMTDSLDKHIKAYEGQSIYDFDNEILLNWYPQRITRLANHARSVLELGLGHGFSTDLFSKHFERHVVLEGSPAVVANFKRRFPDHRAQIVETLFEAFASDERFDVIALGFVLEHVNSPAEILTRYKNFLAIGGRMFVAVPNAEALNRRLGQLAGLLPDLEALSQYDTLLGHQRYYTVDSLTRAITSAGCRVERMEGIYLKPFATNQMISLNLDQRIISALCETGIGYPELCCGLLAEVSHLPSASSAYPSNKG